MIRVYYTRGKGGHELTINGHAGYAEHGQDIVCAGVSAIAFSLVAWIEHNEEEVSALSGLAAESGSFYICCKGTKALETAFDVAVLGLIQIARQYPNHVCIQYDRDSR